MRVLVTRPQPDAARTAERLAALGHEASVAPVTAIVPTGAAPPDAPWDALVLTSAHALPAMRDLPKDRPVFAVGARTARGARDAGFAAVHEGAGDAGRLVDLVRRTLAPGAALMHPAGLDRKPEPERSLRAAGYPLVAWECYAAEPVRALPESTVADLGAGRIGAALHFSRRSAALARERALEAGLSVAFAALRHLCLSEDVASALADLRIEVAAQPTEASLLTLLAEAGAESPPRSR